MSLFWDSLEAGGDRAALIAERESLSYSGLAQRIDRFARGLRARLPASLARPLVLIEATQRDRFDRRLSCLPSSALARDSCGAKVKRNSQVASRAPTSRTSSCGAKAPRGARRSSRASLRRCTPSSPCLLSTSGTTGAAKLVRLSRANLEANASAIAAYLQLSPVDRAITALPYHYSYGMSVLHTQLRSHAALVLTTASLVDAEFWSLARRTK